MIGKDGRHAERPRHRVGRGLALALALALMTACSSSSDGAGADDGDTALVDGASDTRPAGCDAIGVPSVFVVVTDGVGGPRICDATVRAVSEKLGGPLLLDPSTSEDGCAFGAVAFSGDPDTWRVTASSSAGATGEVSDVAVGVTGDGCHPVTETVTVAVSGPPSRCDGACCPVGDDLAALLAAGHAHATVAIHLDEDRRTILGYVMDASDATAPVSEADALAAASGALDYPNPARIAPEVASLLLFSARGGDFGGVAVVGAFTGSVFLAFDIVWTGNGQVTYPAAWRSAEELGGGCAPGTLELGDVRRVPLDLGVGFFEEHVPVVLATVFSTALASAVTAGGMRVDETVVIQVPRYPTSGDTSAHQWVVVLSLSPAPE